MKMERIYLALLAMVLLTAFCLRCQGLRWGVPTAAIPHIPFQSDEVFSMNILTQSVDWRTYHFNPPDAHREGTLGHYIWAFGALAMRALRIIRSFPPDGYCFSDVAYRPILLMARGVSVCFDVGSTLFIYLITLRISKKLQTALLAAFIFAITPFEIIQSAWMRPHTMANFFTLFGVYYSTFLIDAPRRISCLLTKIGIFCGLATAVRYPSLVVFLFPLVLLPEAAKQAQAKNGLTWIVQKSAHLLGAWALGFFLADPYLFIRFRDARRALQVQASYADAAQFQNTGGFLDLSKTWGHIQWIIPYGASPWLWALFYAASVYLLFKAKFRLWFLALFSTLFSNLWLMTKIYLVGPEFVRTVIFLFPFFAIISALAVDAFLDEPYFKRVRFFLVYPTLTFIFVTTLAFDFAYGKAMDESRDVRVQVYEHLRKLIDIRHEKKVVSVGLSEKSPYNYFIAGSTAEVLKKSNKIRLTVSNPESYLDGTLHPEYLILGGLIGAQFEDCEKWIAKLEKSGQYKLIEAFENEPRIFNWTFQLEKAPDDMNYAFPKIYLLQAQGAEG